MTLTMDAPDTPHREPAPAPVRWTVAQFYALLENKIVTERCELIEGEILSKMGQKPAHGFAIMRLSGWLTPRFGGDYVRVQLPLRVPGPDRETSEPEPDIVLLRHSIAETPAATPEAADVQLLIEVSDTTLAFDRSNKAALYARAGIAEYWIVDIAGRQIFAHRQPSANGYGEVTLYTEDETIAVPARPDAPLRIADLLAPQVEKGTQP